MVAVNEKWVPENYKYDPYGKVEIYTGAGVDGAWFTADDVSSSASAVGNPYTFTGRRLDTETGLMYFRNRYYSPSLGRFISRDALEYVDGWNLYRGYFAVNGVDAWGTYTIDADCCCRIDDEIAKAQKTVDLLEKMWLRWKPGETFKTYGLVTMANAAGHRSKAAKAMPTCAQEALEEIETNYAINATQAFQLAVLGGHGYWNWYCWVFEEEGYAKKQFWLARIAIERGRAKWFRGKLKRIREQCVKKYGPTEALFKKWYDANCLPKPSDKKDDDDKDDDDKDDDDKDDGC